MTSYSPPFARPLDQVVEAASAVVFGKTIQIRQALACLLAGGHLLIEDLPGVGKTTLVHTLARLLGLQFSRIQFTSDLLPADITGASFFDRESSRFRFLPGPIFAQLLLADEINRATPKTQSALLEAMEEGQVTQEGETRPLPSPFFVIATQNPAHQIGTFPLPESQLDRFLMRISLGYPDREAEKALLLQGSRRPVADRQVALVSMDDFRQCQAAVADLTVSPALVDYAQALLDASRRSPHFLHGLSPRAGLALLSAARAWAYLDHREMVLPDDLQAVFPAVAGHRLLTRQDGRAASAEALQTLIEAVAIP